jgi:hypothetical protein
MNAKEYAKEFINDLKSDKNFYSKKSFKVIFNKAILNDDPNLTILKKELNKNGLDIIKNDDIDTWTIFKLEK